MSEKLKRLSVLKEIIELNRIGKQEDLLNILKQRGFNVTQATLSRDLKELKIGKIPDFDYGYVYALPNVNIRKRMVSKEEFSSLGFRSIEVSGNIAVIKTKSGYANSFATIIDELYLPEIIGTLAGNDTILLIIKEGSSFYELKKALVLNIPELKEFIKV
jgi:transcriptional regulator of arginine metabolism